MNDADLQMVNTATSPSLRSNSSIDDWTTTDEWSAFNASPNAACRRSTSSQLCSTTQCYQVFEDPQQKDVLKENTRHQTDCRRDGNYKSCTPERTDVECHMADCSSRLIHRVLSSTSPIFHSPMIRYSLPGSAIPHTTDSNHISQLGTLEGNKFTAAVSKSSVASNVNGGNSVAPNSSISEITDFRKQKYNPNASTIHHSSSDESIYNSSRLNISADAEAWVLSQLSQPNMGDISGRAAGVVNNIGIERTYVPGIGGNVVDCKSLRSSKSMVQLNNCDAISSLSMETLNKTFPESLCLANLISPCTNEMSTVTLTPPQFHSEIVPPDDLSGVPSLCPMNNLSIQLPSPFPIVPKISNNGQKQKFGISRISEVNIYSQSGPSAATQSAETSYTKLSTPNASRQYTTIVDSNGLQGQQTAVCRYTPCLPKSELEASVVKRRDPSATPVSNYGNPSLYYTTSGSIEKESTDVFSANRINSNLSSPSIMFSEGELELLSQATASKQTVSPSQIDSKSPYSTPLSTRSDALGQQLLSNRLSLLISPDECNNYMKNHFVSTGMESSNNGLPPTRNLRPPPVTTDSSNSRLVVTNASPSSPAVLGEGMKSEGYSNVTYISPVASPITIQSVENANNDGNNDTSLTTRHDGIPNVNKRYSTSSDSSIMSLFDLRLGTAQSDHQSGRPTANVEADQLEDFEKKSIYVIQAGKGKKNQVSWCADLSLADVREAILCACDSIMNGGFSLCEIRLATSSEPLVLLDNENDIYWGDIVQLEIDSILTRVQKGRIWAFEDFDKLKNGQTYLLEVAKERADLKKLTGDKLRRLRVEIPPLMHVEAQKAIVYMRSGGNLLKHTSNGFPHLRQFQLTPDNKRIIWYSTSKNKSDCCVHLGCVRDIQFGQTTDVFRKYQLPTLSFLSFSLTYTTPRSECIRTLNLTCKDETEFDVWLTGLKAIVSWGRSKDLSKYQLLNHSKRFRLLIKSYGVTVGSSSNGAEDRDANSSDSKDSPTAINLSTCIELPTHTRPEIERKMRLLHERLRALKERTVANQLVNTPLNGEKADNDFNLDSFLAPFNEIGVGESIFRETTHEEDVAMEKRRMFELIEVVVALLYDARTALNGKSRNDINEKSNNERAILRSVNQTLWSAEVDLENAEDMFRRVTDTVLNLGFSKALAELNVQVTEEFQRISSKISSSLSSLFIN